MTEWRKSPAVAVLAVTAFLAIQLTIPISRIGDAERGTSRFAWHIFSFSRAHPTFVVETSDTTEPIDVVDYLARVRDDLDFERIVPPHLCNVVPSAEVVVWETGRHEC